MTDLDKLESDLAATRTSIGDDVARLNETVSPKAVVTSQVDKVKRGAQSAKGRLMGAADPDAAKAGAAKIAGSARDAADSLSGALSDAAGNSPDMVRGRARGNPTATGLIAFGLGWLLSAVAPASSAEQNAAQKLENNAGPLLDPLKESARDVADNLKQPLQESADTVRGAVTDAADKTTAHAKSAADDVRSQLPS